MTEETYAFLDGDGNVINTIIADDEFMANLPDLIDDPNIETPTDLTKSVVRIDTLEEPIGPGWKRVNGKWSNPNLPTSEEEAEAKANLEAAEASRAQKETEDARLQVLRAKVGPGKAGLTQAERDELMLIQLSRS